eukprot:6198151-Pleurochrysis_carterae.AAC.5
MDWTLSSMLLKVLASNAGTSFIIITWEAKGLITSGSSNILREKPCRNKGMWIRSTVSAGAGQNANRPKLAAKPYIGKMRQAAWAMPTKKSMAMVEAKESGYGKKSRKPRHNTGFEADNVVAMSDDIHAHPRD